MKAEGGVKEWDGASGVNMIKYMVYMYGNVITRPTTMYN